MHTPPAPPGTAADNAAGARTPGATVRTWRSDPIRRQLLLVAAFLFALIVAFTGFFSYREWLASRDRAAVATFNLVRLLERQVHDSLSKVDVAVRAAALEIEPVLASDGHAAAARISSFLLRQSELLPEIIALRATDANGVLGDGFGLPAGENDSVAEREYFRQLKAHPESASIVFGPLRAKLSQRWVIGIAHPLRAADGEFAGVLIAAIPVDELQRQLDVLELGQAGAATLRMADMALVARASATRGPLPLGSRKVSAELQAAIAAHPEGGSYIAATAIDGIERINTYLRVADYPLYVLVGMATGDFKSEWASQVAIVFALGLLAIGATALGARSIGTLRAQEFDARLGEARRTAELLRAQEARLQLAASVFTHAHEAIIITDAEGRIVEVNEAFSELTGYARAEVVGQNPRLLKSGRQSATFYASMWENLSRRGYWSGDLWDRRKDGSLFAAQSTISAVRGEDGRVQNYVALFSDITESKNHQQQLEHVAHHDSLTGLPNRVLLGDRLQQAITIARRQRQGLAVAFLDLDGFKAINDTHGHDVGDALLVAVAARMKATLRECDTLARIGGDEFVAVLGELSEAAQLRPVLERLLDAARQPLAIDGLSLQVSASIGVALYPDDGSEPDLLLRCADQAMYRAKQAGRNRFCAAMAISAEHDER